MSSLIIATIPPKGNIPAQRSNSEDSLNGFLGVIQFGEDDFITQSSHVLMRPGVDTNFMPFVVSPHSLERPVHDIGSYVKPIYTCKLEHE